MTRHMRGEEFYKNVIIHRRVGEGDQKSNKKRPMIVNSTKCYFSYSLTEKLATSKIFSPILWIASILNWEPLAYKDLWKQVSLRPQFING